MSRRRRQGVSVQALIGTVLLGFLIVLVVGGLLYWNVFREKPTFDKTTHCPMVNDEIRPTGQTIVLIDKTDLLTSNQIIVLEEFWKNIENRMKPGELLSIYALDADFAKNHKPIFEACKMRRDKDANKYYENVRKIQKAFEENFEKPVQEAIGKVRRDTRSSSKESPLFEMMQLIGEKSVRPYDVEGHRRLLIFSDMLHNTSRFSMFKKRIKYSDFEKTNYAKEMQIPLDGLEVELHYFMNYPEFQDGYNREFWKTFFKSAGAYKLEVHKIGK